MINVCLKIIILFGRTPFLLHKSSESLQITFADRFNVDFLADDSFRLMSHRGTTFGRGKQFVELVAQAVGIAFFEEKSVHSVRH